MIIIVTGAFYFKLEQLSSPMLLWSLLLLLLFLYFPSFNFSLNPPKKKHGQNFIKIK